MHRLLQSYRRRSYDVPPPDVDTTTIHYPGNDPMYMTIPEASVIKAESLKVKAIHCTFLSFLLLVRNKNTISSLSILEHLNRSRDLIMKREYDGKEKGQRRIALFTSLA